MHIQLTTISLITRHTPTHRQENPLNVGYKCYRAYFSRNLYHWDGNNSIIIIV